MNDVAPKDRDIAMVFQNYALYPHMTVYENMAFSAEAAEERPEGGDRPQGQGSRRDPRYHAVPRTASRRRCPAASGSVSPLAAPSSGNPKVFLMDEPLSNLDAKLRNQMRAEIIKLRERIDTTFVYVTHDQAEAMTLGDRIVIMRDGFIQQIGTPQEVFNHPANLFVAGFIGTPQMNLFDATPRQEGRQVRRDRSQGKDFELPAGKAGCAQGDGQGPVRRDRRRAPGARAPGRRRHRRDGRRVRADGLGAAPARELRQARTSSSSFRPRTSTSAPSTAATRPSSTASARS